MIRASSSLTIGSYQVYARSIGDVLMPAGAEVLGATSHYGGAVEIHALGDVSTQWVNRRFYLVRVFDGLSEGMTVVGHWQVQDPTGGPTLYLLELAP